jgi:hypothetical protein
LVGHFLKKRAVLKPNILLVAVVPPAKTPVAPTKVVPAAAPATSKVTTPVSVAKVAPINTTKPVIEPTPSAPSPVPQRYAAAAAASTAIATAVTQPEKPVAVPALPTASQIASVEEKKLPTKGRVSSAFDALISGAKESII